MENNKIIEITRIPKFILILFTTQLILVLFLLQKNSNIDLEFLYILIPASFLLFSSEIKMELSNKSIRYKLFPIQFNYKEIKWEETQNLKITKIDESTDLTGWGFRYSKKYDQGTIVEKDYAIFLTLKNGKKYTFTIKDKDLIVDFLKKNNIAFQFI